MFLWCHSCFHIFLRYRVYFSYFRLSDEIVGFLCVNFWIQLHKCVEGNNFLVPYHPSSLYRFFLIYFNLFLPSLLTYYYFNFSSHSCVAVSHSSSFRTYSPFLTTNFPISPVSWSSFISYVLPLRIPFLYVASSYVPSFQTFFSCPCTK